MLQVHNAHTTSDHCLKAKIVRIKITYYGTMEVALTVMRNNANILEAPSVDEQHHFS